MADLIKKIRTSSGDSQIDYNALANLPTISNPNLLINSDFRNPVNQRGNTSFTANAGDQSRKYWIDRWYIQDGVTATKQNGYIKLTASASSEYGYFCQPLEQALENATYTITINVKSVGIGSTVYFKSGTSAYGKALVAGINVITVSMSLSSVEIQLHPNSTIELYWIKLERGTTSTAFVPRLIAEELMLCKRYFQIYNGDRFAVLTQTYTIATETNGRMNLPVEMRVKPSITVYSFDVKQINNGDTVTITAKTGESISKDAINIKGTHASTAVAPRYIYAKFAVDAEIY